MEHQIKQLKEQLAAEKKKRKADFKRELPEIRLSSAKAKVLDLRRTIVKETISLLKAFDVSKKKS